MKEIIKEYYATCPICKKETPHIDYIKEIVSTIHGQSAKAVISECTECKTQYIKGD